MPLIPLEHCPSHAGTAGWGASHSKRAIRRFVSGFCNLATSQSTPGESGWGVLALGPVGAAGAEEYPAVFTYRELIPMGTVTQAASAFAVSIGRRRLQPSDKSLLTEVGALPTAGPPLAAGDAVPGLVGTTEGLAAHLLRRKRLRSHSLLLVCI